MTTATVTSMFCLRRLAVQTAFGFIGIAAAHAVAAPGSTPEPESVNAVRATLIDDDTKRGYQPMTFEDFELDKKGLRPGTKLDLSGSYKKEGNMELLESDVRGLFQEPTFSVGLLTEDAPRDVRKRLLRATPGPICDSGFCRMRVLGRVTPCELSQGGRRVKDTVCLVVDDIRTAEEDAADAATRQRANNAIASVKAEGVQSLAPAASAVIRYTVQVGAFADANEARVTRLKVEGLGLRTYTQISQTPDGSRIRVRIGPFATRDAADAAFGQVRAAGLPAVVLTL